MNRLDFARAVAFVTPLALALVVAFVPARSDACGGMAFEEHAERTGGMGGQELFVAVGSEFTTLVFSPTFSETSGEAAYLLPIMVPPTTVAEGDSILFERLHEHTAPTIIWDEPQDEPQGCSAGCLATKAGDGALEGGDGDGDDLDVYLQGSTATYDYVVVGGDDGGEIVTWLTDNGFVIPSAYEQVLSDYVDDGWIFMVASLHEVVPDEELGATLAPLVLQYPSFPAELLNMPFGMAGYSLPPDGFLDVTLYLFGPTMVVPQESLVQIDESELVVTDEQSNYEELVEEASHGADGHAWVLEFSEAGWDLQGLNEGVGTADEAWLQEFAEGLGVDDGRLVRLRTEYTADELVDLGFHQIDPIDQHGELEAHSGHAAGASGAPAIGNLLLFLPLVLVRRRRGSPSKGA